MENKTEKQIDGMTKEMEQKILAATLKSQLEDYQNNINHLLDEMKKAIAFNAQQLQWIEKKYADKE